MFQAKGKAYTKSLGQERAWNVLGTARRLVRLGCREKRECKVGD